MVRRADWLFRVGIGLLVGLAVGSSSCSRKSPEERLDFPTADRLAVKPSAVGVPYDRFVVIRHDEGLVAVNLHATSQLGDRVLYQWYRANADGWFAPEASLEMGEAEAVERPHTGRIAIPGFPTLVWSRGSQESGWIYWPEQDTGLAIFSRAFATLPDIETRTGSGRWLQRDTHEP